MKILNARKLITLAALAALPTMPHALFAGERIDASKVAPADGTVSVENVAGEVRITGWEKNEVRLEGELDEQAERLEFEQRGDFTTIRVVYPRRYNNIDGSELNIRVPMRSKIEVDTVSADIDISGVAGTLRADSVSGDISASGGSKEYILETVSGSIRLKGTEANSRINAQSVSGDIRLSDANGELRAGSVSGDVMVDGSTLSRATISNTSGDIDFEAVVDDDGNYRFEAISGSVTLVFAAVPAGNFEIATFSGGIDNEFGPEPERTSRFTPGRELKFEQGDGKAEYRINTLSGNVRLEVRD